MTQLALAAGGAALGYLTFGAAPLAFGMTGAQIGWGAGSILGSFLGGGGDVQLPGQFGPRLGDLKVQTSTYGNAIPRAFGTVRIAGNVIWAPPIIEIATTQTVETGGGKGGGAPSSSQEQTTYAYFADFAVAICEGPIVGIRKIWANGDLVADEGDDSTVISGMTGVFTILNGVSIPAGDGFYNTMSVYLGTETQTADATMAAETGNLTPAYRGTAYVVFNHLALERYGNRLPNLEFEVVTSGERTIMEPRLFYTLPGGVSYHATGELSGELAARRNSPGAQYFWTVLDIGSPIQGRRLAAFNNYADGALVVQQDYPNPIAIVSENGMNGRIWFHEQGTASVRAMSPSGQVWNFGTYGGIDVPRISQIYEFKDPAIEDPADQANEPRVFIEYNPATPGVVQILHGNASGLGTLTEVATGRSINTFIDSADRIDGRVYIKALQFLGALDSRLGYVEAGDVNGTFNVIRDYDTGGEPHGMVGRDGYLYVRSGDLGFFNVIEKMNAEGGVVDSITLPGVASGDTSLIRMVQDAAGMLYVQVGQEVFRIVSGTMELDEQTTLPNSDYWIMPSDAFEGRGVLVSYGATGHRDELYVLMDTIRSDAPLLSEVQQAICLLGDLAVGEIDVVQLSPYTVEGVVYMRTTPRAMSETLMGTFFYDAVESDNKIKFVVRGGAVAVTIPEDDLGAHTGAPSEMPDPMRVSRKQEMELPVQMDLSYLSRAIDYQISVQRSRRLITQSEQVSSLQVPIVLTDDEAKHVADTHIFSAWVERESHEFELGRKYLAYEPTDIVAVVKNGITHNVRIVQKDEGGDGVIKIKAVADYATIYSQASTGVAPQAEAQSVTSVGPTTIEFLDIPLLRNQDDDAGFYYAGSGGDDWRGVNLYQSTDSGVTYTPVGSLLAESTMGHTTDVLGDWDADRVEFIDEANIVTVVVTAGSTLESITRDELLDGGNPALIGGELLQFRDATLVDTDTYELTGLLRGRKGSELYMADHAAGERFVFLNDNLRTVPQAVAMKDQALFYKPVSIGRTVTQTNALAFVNTARRKLPLSPVQLGAGKNSSGDWLMEWRRRTRYDATWLSDADVPLGESIEKYNVRIMDGVTVLRTIEATSESATYTVAQQTTDWGAEKGSLLFEVAQVSGEVGEGPATSYFVNHPDPFASNVVLLMHMDGVDGGTTFTEERGHAVTVNGTCTTVTAQKKFGTTSAFMALGGGGIGNGLSLANHADWDFGYGDFTIEFWIRWNGVSANALLLCTADTTLEFTSLLIYRNAGAGGSLSLFQSSDLATWDISNNRSIGTLGANVWKHLAMTRSGTTFRFFVDGVQSATWTSSLPIGLDEGLYIGLNSDSWIDELRITKGVSRYNTTPFTPPLDPFDI